jgi:adenylylsulfate reductase subunit A
MRIKTRVKAGTESHPGASGAWVSGPEDLAPQEYFWGHTNM